MNEATLATGRELGAVLAGVEDSVRELAIDITEVWPGRRNEALIAADRVAKSLRDARTDLGVLVSVLAQDTPP